MEHKLEKYIFAENSFDNIDETFKIYKLTNSVTFPSPFLILTWYYHSLWENIKQNKIFNIDQKLKYWYS